MPSWCISMISFVHFVQSALPHWDLGLGVDLHACLCIKSHMKSPTIQIVKFSHENGLNRPYFTHKPKTFILNISEGKCQYSSGFKDYCETADALLLFSRQMRYSRYQWSAISLKKLTSLTYTQKESIRATPKWHFKELRVRTALCKICQEHVRFIFSHKIKRKIQQHEDHF